jgi:hypothetical protein
MMRPQKIDREEWQRNGEIYPADPNQMARLSSPLYGGLLPDGNLNQALIKQGRCWWYRKYAQGNSELARGKKNA